jgi:signal peptidase I
VNGFHPIELDRPPDPQIAVVPLYDEPTEVLDRPTPKPAATGQPVNQAKPAKPAHPPRAVVRRRRARRKALEWPFLIVFAVVSAFLIRQYVVQTFYIPSASMHETLIEGDRVLVNKVGYHLHDIHRGDVVVFRKPPNLNVSEDDLIKRVVALPGETVEGRGGKVYVNGAPLDEPYVEPLCHGTGEFPKVTVPAGTLWMMGDNRCNSSDSRVFGPIDEHLVVGRAFVIAWPFDRLSWL